MTEQRLHMLRYAITGKEFDVMDALTEKGITHWRGTRVEFERRGKSRVPDAYDYPAIPNYIWVSPLMHQVHLLRDIKHMTQTYLFMTHADVTEFAAFRAAVEEREREARRIIGNREAIQLYRKGEQIDIKEGPFATKLAFFERMVQGGKDPYPRVRANVEMFGGYVPVELDPLAVDKVKSA